MVTVREYIYFLWITSCVSTNMLEARLAPVTIGIIMDRQSSTMLDNTTYLPSNVSVQWYFTDYTELFHVFRRVQLLDHNHTVDLIVLVDYAPPTIADRDPLHAGNKGLIKLNWRSWSTKIAKEDITDLGSTIENTDFLRPGIETTGNGPYCRLRSNLSETASGVMTMADTWTTAPSRTLAKLVGSLDWKSVFVFYENATEEETRLFTDQLPFHGTVFSLYNVDMVPDLHETLVRLYDSTLKLEQEIHIAVVCRVGCVLKMFTAANTFDARRQDFQTSLDMFSRWIAVVYNYNILASSALQQVAGNLNNVAIVAVPEVMSLKPEVLLWEYDNRSLADKATWKTTLLERIDASTSWCSHYIIDTLYWTDKGREFHTVGYADFDGKVTTTSELFPNLKYGYSRRKFIVTTAPYPPYVIKSDVNGSAEFGGIYMDLLEELSRVLNFTYTIIEPPDGKWGGVTGLENGAPIFNGMIGQLQRQECDFAAAPLTIIPARDDVVDFTYPVSHEYSTVVVRKPDINAQKWRTLLNPFKLEVLLYIGGALIVVTVLVFFIEKYGPYYSHPEHMNTRRLLGGLHHLHDSFWYMYGALLCQGGAHLPDSIAGRSLVGFWWLVCIVIVGTYSGNLIAFLTVSKFEAPFNTLQEMVDLSGTYQWGTLGGTFWETIFTTSNVPIFRDIGDAMVKFNETDASIFNPNVAFHLARVKEGGYAWIGDVTSIELAMSTECDLFVMKEKFLPMTDAFAFQHNSPHTAIFSEQIMKSHEAGLLGIWRRKWWPKLNFCNDGARPESKPISLLDVQSAFYVCLIGVFVGSVAFVTELTVYRVKAYVGTKREPRASNTGRAEETCPSHAEIH